MIKKKDKIQETQYYIPYHWYYKKGEYLGREYFGYLSICKKIIKDVNLETIKVLDAGCGDGRFLYELKKLGIKNLYGIDHSSKAIAFAKSFLPDVNFVKADLRSIGMYLDGFFDYIYLIETLEHIYPEDIESILGELRRILNSSGSLILTVPSKLKPINKKHYQHFNKGLLEKYLSPHFKKIKFIGQFRSDRKIIEFIYKFIDNRYWTIKPLVKYYNLIIWPRIFNESEVEKARRIIAICSNN